MITDKSLTADDLITLGVAPRQAQIILLMQRNPDKEWASDTLRVHFGETLGAVSYHVRKLREEGWIRQAREARVRGAVQTWYLLNKRTLVAKRAEARALHQEQAEREEALALADTERAQGRELAAA